MKNNSSRNKILNRVKKSLNIQSTSITNNPEIDINIDQELKKITPSGKELLIEQFRDEVEKVSGEFIFVPTLLEASKPIVDIFNSEGVLEIATTAESECIEIAKYISQKFSKIKFFSTADYTEDNRKIKFTDINTSIVNASYAIADIGSVVFCYDKTLTSYPHFLSDHVIVLVNENDVVANQFELFTKLDMETAKNMVIVAGPSRTADIEKVLVLGAHGPRKLTVILYRGKN